MYVTSHPLQRPRRLVSVLVFGADQNVPLELPLGWELPRRFPEHCV